MGRLIDCNDVYNAIQITTDNFGVAKKVVEDNMLTMLSKIGTIEAIPKADYEARLKADMAAMLTELQLEIEEKVHSYHSRYCPACEAIDRKSVSNLIEQKINALKADQEET